MRDGWLKWLDSEQPMHVHVEPSLGVADVSQLLLVLMNACQHHRLYL